jgi:hypothetical protein
VRDIIGLVPLIAFAAAVSSGPRAEVQNVGNKSNIGSWMSLKRPQMLIRAIDLEIINGVTNPPEWLAPYMIPTIIGAFAIAVTFFI